MIAARVSEIIINCLQIIHVNKEKSAFLCFVVDDEFLPQFLLQPRSIGQTCKRIMKSHMANDFLRLHPLQNHRSQVGKLTKRLHIFFMNAAYLIFPAGGEYPAYVSAIFQWQHDNVRHTGQIRIADAFRICPVILYI